MPLNLIVEKERKPLTSFEIFDEVKMLVGDELQKMNTHPHKHDKRVDAIDKAFHNVVDKLSIQAGLLTPDMFEWG